MCVLRKFIQFDYQMSVFRQLVPFDFQMCVLRKSIPFNHQVCVLRHFIPFDFQMCVLRKSIPFDYQMCVLRQSIPCILLSDVRFATITWGTGRRGTCPWRSIAASSPSAASYGTSPSETFPLNKVGTFSVHSVVDPFHFDTDPVPMITDPGRILTKIQGFEIS